MNKKCNSMNGFFYLINEIKKEQPYLFLYYVLNIFFTLLYSLGTVLIPRFMIEELTGQERIKYIVMIITIYLILISASGYFLSHIKNKYQFGIFNIRYYFMEKTKEKIMKIHYKNLENPKYLDEFWRVLSATSDIDIGVQGVLTQIFVLSANAVTSLFFMGILSILNLWIVILLGVNIYLVFIIRSKASKFEVKKSKTAIPYKRRQQYLVNIMEDFIYGKDIRIFGLSNFILNKLNSNHKPKREIEINIQKHNYRVDFVESVLSCIRDIVIYLYLIAGVINGNITIADFTMNFMIVASLTITLENVFKDIAYVNSDIFRITEMREFLEIPNEEDECNNMNIPISEQYEITFQHVSFSYPNSEKNVFTNLNFNITAGQKLAIVGINGAGKTTLVKLITRLYDPSDGQILLNGVDIKNFEVNDYRNLISTVFQDIHLFAMSLKENVSCSDKKFDDMTFRYAIENSGLMNFYEQNRKNPEMLLTRYLTDSGIDLSGGEKQKIGMARALYKNSKIMIFDEPTAALDANAEYFLYHKLSAISDNKTLIFISHRLASTRFCDEIVLIDGGRIAEKGTHDELIKRKGLYYKMFITQKQYYEKGENNSDEKLKKGVV